MKIRNTKRHPVLSLILLLGALVILPTVAFASPVIRTGELVAVEKDQVVEGDFYGMGGVATLSGAVEGDAYLMSGSVTINAPVSADVTAVAGAVQVHAPIADDLRVVGGEITLGNEVSGDVVVFGGVLRVLSTASVEGDVIFFGGELVVDGPVDGSIFGAGKDVRINAAVGGNIDLRASGQLTLGDRAEVLGDITYKGRTDIVRSQNAVVVGDIQKEMLETETVSVQAVLLPLLAGLFAALTAFLIFRPYLAELVRRTRISYGMHGLIGLAVFIGMPFAALVLMVSVLGIMVGVFLIGIYIALLIASWVVGSVMAGTFLMQTISKKQKTVSLWSVVVGVVLMDTLLIVPFVGPLLVFAIVLIGMGAIATHAYGTISPRKG